MIYDILQYTFHWWDSTLPLPLHFSIPRRWHIALALAILSAAQYLSIARQCQRVAVSGGHCHDRAMSIFRSLALAVAVTTEGPAVAGVVQPAAATGGPSALKSLWVILTKWRVRVSERLRF